MQGWSQGREMVGGAVEGRGLWLKSDSTEALSDLGLGLLPGTSASLFVRKVRIPPVVPT